MKLKESISIEDIEGTTFKIRVVEALDHGKAALTHYFHNHQNGAAKALKREAVNYVKHIFKYKYPDTQITYMVAEEALQTLLFDFKKNNVPFPEPKNPKFKFIDLFAGIGGFRIAMQNLGGKCVFSSEWDDQAKRTYEANFGEVPFGDITKEETKNSYLTILIFYVRIPLPSLFNCRKTWGFEDTRGTLF